MRYLNGTLDLGLLYHKEESKECVGFSDADWAGDQDDRRSMSGYMFQISKKQSCVALSTAEAEYMALASATQEAVWMRKLLTDLQTKTEKPTVIFEDNQSAIFMAKNPQYHGRAKHIDIKYHFIRDQIANGVINLKYCNTDDMVADMFTKGLSGEQFKKLRQLAGLKPVS